MEGEEAAADGWRERKPPPEAPAPDLEGRRILHLRSSVRRAQSMEEEAAPPCAVVGEGGRPAVRRRWEEEAGRRSPPSPDLRMRRRPRPPLLAPPPLLTGQSPVRGEQRGEERSRVR